MAYQIKTIDNFILQNINVSNKDFVNKKGFVLLVKQNWCGHCTKYFPEFEKQALELKNSNIMCLYVEGTESPDILSAWKEIINPAFQINGFPSLFIFDSNGSFIQSVEDRDNLINECGFLI